MPDIEEDLEIIDNLDVAADEEPYKNKENQITGNTSYSPYRNVVYLPVFGHSFSVTDR